MPQNIWLRGGDSDINNQHVTAQKQRMGRFHCKGSSMRSAERAEDNLGRSSRSGNWLSSEGAPLSKEKDYVIILIKQDSLADQVLQ